MQESASRDLNKFVVRLPDGFRDRIKELAAANRRSMNAEIVTILERAIFDPIGPDLTIAATAKASEPIIPMDGREDQNSEFVSGSAIRRIIRRSRELAEFFRGDDIRALRSTKNAKGR